MGQPLNDIAKALMTFLGVKRRQEILGEPNGVLVIEDFAHHPTAVAETLKALKLRYPHRNLIAVFEPRSATSRRKVFQKDYVESFRLASAVYVKEAFDQTKIDPSERFSSEQLVTDIIHSGKNAYYCVTSDDIVTRLSSTAQRGDVVVIMSNGSFDGIYQKLLKSLEFLHSTQDFKTKSDSSESSTLVE